MLWSVGLIVTCVSFLNLYSTRLTSAMYVMLLRLATPYIVVVLNRVLLHEQLPSHFLAYLMVTVLGTALVLSPRVLSSTALQLSSARKRS